MVPVWVLEVGLKGAELATYVALRSYCDRGGHPKVATIAEMAGVSKRTAERAIARFQDLDLMSVTHQHRADGSLMASEYQLRDIRPAAIRRMMPLMKRPSV
jgi:hypothetical protein